MLIKPKEIWTDILQLFGKAWWIEISTALPNVTYYFGPFVASQDAESSSSGYMQDLQNESAQGIQITIKRCRPGLLTISREIAENF